LKLFARAVFTLMLLAMPAVVTVAQQRPATPSTGRARAATPSTSKPAAARPAVRRPASGASERLDGIAAVVNDDVILESDVEEQVFLFVQQARVRPDSTMLDTLRRQVLNQLIDFKVLVAEAKRQGVALAASDQKQMDQQVEESLRDTKGRFESEEAFQAQLARENTSEARLREKYRSDLERQILAEHLIEKQIPLRPVPATEAEAFFASHPDKFPRLPAEVKVQLIQIAPSADSVTNARARARALEVRKRLVAGEKFAKLAGELSDDPNTSRSGGDLGVLPRGALDRPLDDAAFTLKLNTVSEPVRSAVGWHLVEVLDRDTVRTAAGRDSVDRAGRPAMEAHVRHILIRVPVGDADVERARALAERVRAEAVKGSDFGALARRYSQYNGQAAADGDLGFVSLASFQPDIRGGIDTVAVGGVSLVLENSVGFNVFKINDRKPERSYSLDEVRSELPQVVGQIKQRERIDEWVKALRAKAHIEVRSS
jgi:peptidyl-prolyl cis-trans isomerase SurA